MKHRLKLLMRELYARVLYHTGLHAVVSRLMPRRLLILAGHCVTAPEHNGFLPPDMKIEGERLERMMRWFMRGYDVCTVGEAYERLRGEGSRSLVALSMDDGYKDNATHLLPMLQRIGIGATVFLESRPLDERRVNWSHKFFWILRSIDPSGLLARYSTLAKDEEVVRKLNEAGRRPGDPAYHLKRVLKYEAAPEDRDRVLDQIFAELGGDEAALCDELYMTWDDARDLARAGFELGGHTVSHHVLATLDDEHERREVVDCQASMERALGEGARTFAYPFGRRWDYDKVAVSAAEEAGYLCAVNTHAGTNRPDTPRYELHRWMIDDGAKMHLLATEACGGFDLLRKFGLDLSE